MQPNLHSMSSFILPGTVLTWLAIRGLKDGLAVKDIPRLFTVETLYNIVLAKLSERGRLSPAIVSPLASRPPERVSDGGPAAAVGPGP